MSMPEQVTSSRKQSYLLSIREAMQEEMRRDKNVILLGEDVARHGGGFGVSKELWEEFGDAQVRNTPISENCLAGMALGAAMTGCRPILEFMFMDFSALAIDQICNEAAKVSYMYGGQTNAPIVFRCPQGGLSYKSAGAHHSQSLEAWFAHIPGLKVVFPATPYDAKGLLKAAIRDPNPVVYIEHKALYSTEGPVPEKEYLIPIGKADIKRSGSQATIIAAGYMLHYALEAAQKLAVEGIEAEVIDPRTLNPLDEDCIFTSIRKTHRVVLVQEACQSGGVAAEWGMRINEACFDWLDATIVRVAGSDVPIPYAQSLENKVWPNPTQIVEAVKKVCYYK
jgi:pyruvate/2-oxoglutarate/acetoin dehydrogenase E1 component